MNCPALVYNAEIRNNGTARRVVEAMTRMGYLEKGLKRYNRPFYGEPDISAHDFWLFVDDGRDDIPMMEFPHPNACWLVDTHLGYEVRLKWARMFDFAFVAQLPTVERMKADGVEQVSWLPLACLPCVDPTAEEMSKMSVEKLGPYGLRKLHDLIFVGHLNRGPTDKQGNDRVVYLDRVFREFPNSWLAFGLFMEEAALRYARGRVGFNISIKDDLNMRFFEVLSYGVCLLTNRDVVGWKELGFEEGKHFLGYQGEEEAIEQARWALRNPLEREAIARAGNELVRAKHTYQNRIEQMLEVVGA